jgi:hypothetical protein
VAVQSFLNTNIIIIIIRLSIAQVERIRLDVMRAYRRSHGNRIRDLRQSGMTSASLAIQQRVGLADGSWKDALTEAAAFYCPGVDVLIGWGLLKQTATGPEGQPDHMEAAERIIRNFMSAHSRFHVIWTSGDLHLASLLGDNSDACVQRCIQLWRRIVKYTQIIMTTRNAQVLAFDDVYVTYHGVFLRLVLASLTVSRGLVPSLRRHLAFVFGISPDEKPVEDLFRRVERLYHHGTESGLIADTRLYHAMTEASRKCWPTMHHETVTLQDWERAQLEDRDTLVQDLKVKPKRGNLEYPKSAIAVNLAHPQPFPRPLAGQKTFGASGISGQTACEACLMAMDPNVSWIAPQNIRPMTHSWGAKFVPHLAGKEAIDPTILVDEARGASFLCLHDMGGRAISAVEMRNVGLHQFAVIRPIVHHTLIVDDVTATGTYMVLQFIELQFLVNGPELVYGTGDKLISILEAAVERLLVGVDQNSMKELFTSFGIDDPPQSLRDQAYTRPTTTPSCVAHNVDDCGLLSV